MLILFGQFVDKGFNRRGIAPSKLCDLALRQGVRLDSCLTRGNMAAEIGRAAKPRPDTGGDIQMIQRSFSRAFVLAACCSTSLVAISGACAADF
jgi:hypothetical protein